jgi:hypothetical protein
MCSYGEFALRKIWSFSSLVAFFIACSLAISAPGFASGGASPSATTNDDGAYANYDWLPTGGSLDVCDLQPDGHHAEAKLQFYYSSASGWVTVATATEYRGAGECSGVDVYLNGSIPVKVRVEALNMEKSKIVSGPAISPVVLWTTFSN